MSASPDIHPDLALLQACIAEDERAQRLLMRRLLPVLRAQVNAVLFRYGYNNAQELNDVLQDVLVELFRNGAQELRRWDPSRGLTLESFVRLVARRFALRRIGQKTRRDAKVEAVDPILVDAAVVSPAPQTNALEDQNELDAILEALQSELNERDRELFERVFLQQEDAADTMQAMGISYDALKKWRSRLYARVRAISERLERPQVFQRPVRG